MLDCLQNVIGIRGCNADTPETSIYINDLTGISKQLIDAIANDETIGFKGVFAKATKNAATQLYNNAVVKLAKRYKLKQVLRSIDITGNRMTDVINASNVWRGISVITNSGLDKNYTRSPLLGISVQQISVYSDGDVSGVAIQVQDYFTGTILFEKIVDLADGNNIIHINRTFNNAAIFICYDGAAVDTLPYAISDTVNTSCCNACDCIGITGEIVAGTRTKTDVLHTEADHTEGLQAVVSIGCNYENIICYNKGLFARPMQLLTGIELINEGMFNMQLNLWNLNSEKMKELRDLFWKQYESTLSNIITGIDLNSCDCCIECDEPVTTKWITP